MNRLILVPVVVVALLASVSISLAVTLGQKCQLLNGQWAGCCTLSHTTSQSPNVRWPRPVPMGISIGNVTTVHKDLAQHTVCGADTAGALFINNYGYQGINSTNHGDSADYVPTRQYNGIPLGPFPKGSGIDQPGPGDMLVAGTGPGTPYPAQYCDPIQMANNAGIGQLFSSFTVTSLSGDNIIDNAFSTSFFGDTSSSILNIGVVDEIPYGNGRPWIGMQLQYMGAGSCWRTFHITQNQNFTYRDFDGHTVYNFTDQYQGDIADEDGDSAAIAFTMGTCPQAVGVVYARDPTLRIVLNPMPYVMQFNNYTHLVGRSCNGTTSIAQSGIRLAQANAGIGVTEGPFPPAEQAPSEQGNHVWPNPSDYVRQMHANDTLEQQAEGKAVNDLTGVLDTIEKTVPPTSSSTIYPDGAKGHRVIVFSTGPLAPAARDMIPPTIDGYPVVIHEIPHPAPPLNETR